MKKKTFLVVFGLIALIFLTFPLAMFGATFTTNGVTPSRPIPDADTSLNFGSGKSFQINGGQFIIGTHSFSITLTGDTTLTFPTSGTLATTANIAALSSVYQPLSSNLTGWASTSSASYQTTAQAAAAYQAIDAALTNLAAGSDFVQFAGPTTSTKVFTLPNVSANLLTDANLVTVAQGGLGTGTIASGQVLIGNGAGAITSEAKTSAATASTIAERDANKNFAVNAVYQASQTYTTAFTLTAASPNVAIYTGAATTGSISIDATTLPVGAVWTINNTGTGSITLKSFGGGTIATVPAGVLAQAVLNLNNTSSGSYTVYQFMSTTPTSVDTTTLTTSSIYQSGNTFYNIYIGGVSGGGSGTGGNPTDPQYETLTLSSDTTFIISQFPPAGKAWHYVWKIKATGGNRQIAWPSDWKVGNRQNSNSFIIPDGSSVLITLDAFGQTDADIYMHISATGEKIPAGTTASDLPYNAANSGDWAGGTPPTNVSDALDRIAAAFTANGLMTLP